ncbi:MAG TPA: DUF3108 domain-containing protein [Kofleriaceae bacterium]
MLCRLLLVLVIGACGSRRAEPIVAGATAAKLPEGPPYVTPGERISYQLQIGGMNLATYDVGVGSTVEQVGGHRAIAVQSHAKSQGLVSMVANLDTTFTSWIDVETGRPLRWTIEERGPDGAVKEGADARLFERKGDQVPVEVRWGDKAPVVEMQKVSMPDVWDYNALVIAVRAWEPKRGSTVTAEVMRSMYLWHVTVIVRGEENVTTEIGDFPALRIDGISYRLRRDGTRDAGAPERNFTLWISNDDGRVPLQSVAQSDYGDIKMTLVDYQPGNGNRLRP